MNLRILNEEKNSLLARTSYEIELKFDGVTPSNADLANKMAEKYEADAECVIVRQISTNFGGKSALAKVDIYSDKARKTYTEKVTKHMKKQMASN